MAAVSWAAFALVRFSKASDETIPSAWEGVLDLCNILEYSILRMTYFDSSGIRKAHRKHVCHIILSAL